MKPIEMTSTRRVEDIANEDGSLEIEDQGDDIERYQLARDQTRRTRKAPERYGYADLVSFALLHRKT